MKYFLEKLMSFRPGKLRLPRVRLSWQGAFLVLAILAVPVFGYYIWRLNTAVPGLDDTLKRFPSLMGKAVSDELRSVPALAFKKDGDTFMVTDDDSTGIRIEYPNKTEGDAAKDESPKDALKLAFPSDYSKPLEVDLGQGKKFTLIDQGAAKGYRSELLDSSLSQNGQGSILDIFTRKRAEEMRAQPKKDQAPVRDILSYRSPDSRKTILYSYRNDGASGAKKLKNWTIYAKGSGTEEETYVIDGATAKINDSGDLDIFLKSEQDVKNETATAQVSPSLLERAKRTLEKENGAGAMDGNRSADLTIPKPYFVDKDGVHHGADWQVSDEGKTFSVSISDAAGLYPIALDPTLSFTAPGQSGSGSVITGNASPDAFGYAAVSGDFNSDGRTDLAISSPRLNPDSRADVGRVYIFYNDGLYSMKAEGADVAITGGVSGNRFGETLVAGDFNADGKTDLAAGSIYYGSNQGRVYVFYQNSGGGFNASLGVTDAGVTYTGSSGDYFGFSLVAGDFNSDGKTDLAVGSPLSNTSTGKVSMYYQQSSGGLTTLSWTITGAATNTQFGGALVSGDFNADGKTDIAAAASAYSSGRGRAYMIFQDTGGGFSVSTASAGGVVTLTGEANGDGFCGGASEAGEFSIVTGDFNADGKTDLACGASEYSGGSGRAYIFYQPSSGGFVTVLASAASVKIDMGSIPGFGYKMTSGDFNSDGRTDLVASAIDYGTQVTTHIFYNDGSYPANADLADVIIYGSSGDLQSGPNSFATGDFNSDGKTDLAVGMWSYATNTGREYVYYSQNGVVNKNSAIAGEAASNKFGYAMTSGDFNGDGRIDLAVGAYGYNPGSAANTGRVYVFYNDGSYPTTAGTADAIMTGEASGNQFGFSLAAGDMNRDGKTDLLVSAPLYSSNAGRIYAFYNGSITTENASGADLKITGGASIKLGSPLVVGDLNGDGWQDIAAAGLGYTNGRTYIFYNDGSIPTTYTSADATLTGENAGDDFGSSMTVGDFNSDGRIDIATGADGYSASDGRVYIFYQPSGGYTGNTGGASANDKISGESGSGAAFGASQSSMVSGDFNNDGKTDLVASAPAYNANAGRVYIFYQNSAGGFTVTLASNADVKIDGTGAYFGTAVAAGDFNADGRTDLLVGEYYADNLAGASWAGLAFVFYNDGSYPTTDAGADVTIGGDAASEFFGYSLATGDFNSDGRTDFVVGANGVSSGTGKVYFFDTRDNFSWQTHVSGGPGGMNVSPGVGQEVRIVGETAPYEFGDSMVAGDFNADGRMDLAVGTSYYTAAGGPVGAVYIFYDDGSIPSAASSADSMITGHIPSFDYFGRNLAAGDLNRDGKTDLVVGSPATAWIFYNKGTGFYPSTDDSADMTITGISNGASFALGDFNADGKNDLAIGDPGGGGGHGRACIFYFDGSVPTTMDTADVILSGETTGGVTFGASVSAGDFNADGKTDLAVSDPHYNGSDGKVYLFYNGSITTKNASAANAKIATVNSNIYFGYPLISGDFNADGKMDFAVQDSHNIFLFYNAGTGTYPANDASASATIAIDAGFIVAGDFNGDGKTDLAATDATSTKIFYNDGSYPSTDAAADIVIAGGIGISSSGWNSSLVVGDFNADGRTDLAISNPGATVNGVADAGTVSIYTMNDTTMTGDASSQLGYAMTAGDFNADGKIDLAVGAPGYSSGTGRVYIFYNDGTLVSGLTSSSADSVITGGATGDAFGQTLAAGDFNSDGKTDLLVGADYSNSAHTGRAYIFNQNTAGGFTASIAASSSNTTFTNSQTWDYFSCAFAVGDFNSDGKTDIAIGSRGYSNGAYTGRVYIYHQGSSGFASSIAVGSANVTLTGETSGGNFGASLVSGDFNADGKTDLAVSAYGYDPGSAAQTGRVYVFYQGSGGFSSIAASSADVKITGENTNDLFGGWFDTNLVAGDFNADGKTDLAVGAMGYKSYASDGRVYIFFQNSAGGFNSSIAASSAGVIIDGETSWGSWFGSSLAAGDFNADGKTDLAVSSEAYNYTGKTYIFYDDGAYPSNAANADVITTGDYNGGSHGYFGSGMVAGDFNADGKTDLAVGAYGYSSSAGRAYVFISEAKTVENAQQARTRGTVKVRGTLLVR